ncbi:hypothetical protein Tco_0069305, partial [Tanacetum coccineum]
SIMKLQASQSKSLQVHAPYQDSKRDPGNEHREIQGTSAYVQLCGKPKQEQICEFYDDKGHNTDECIHLRKQIKEAVEFGHLAHLVKEIKQESTKGDHRKATHGMFKFPVPKGVVTLHNSRVTLMECRMVMESSAGPIPETPAAKGIKVVINPLNSLIKRSP